MCGSLAKSAQCCGDAVLRGGYMSGACGPSSLRHIRVIGEHFLVHVAAENKC